MNYSNSAGYPNDAAQRRSPPARRYRPDEESSSLSGGGGSADTFHSRPEAATTIVRGVSFNPETRVYLVPAHWEMPDADRVRVWYSPRELEGLSRDVRKTVKYVRRRLREDVTAAAGASSSSAASIDDEEKGVCDRGLEHLRSGAHMEQRRINRDCAQKAVFDEQTRQMQADDGTRDVEELRSASEFGSAWSKKTAIEAGGEDEKAARRIHSEAPSTSSRGESVSRGRRLSAPAATPKPLSSEELLQQAMELCPATDCTHERSHRPLSRSSSSSSNARSRRRCKSTSPLRSLRLTPPNTDAAAAAPLTPQGSLSERKLRPASLDVVPLSSKAGSPKMRSSKTSNSAGRGLLAMINGRQGL